MNCDDYLDEIVKVLDVDILVTHNVCAVIMQHLCFKNSVNTKVLSNGIACFLLPGTRAEADKKFWRWQQNCDGAIIRKYEIAFQ